MAVLFSPSSGYLIAWPFTAVVTPPFIQVLPTYSPRRAFLSAFATSIIGGLLVVHAFGAVRWVLIAKLNWTQALLSTLVFVPGDLIKGAFGAMVENTVARGLPDWHLGGRST